MKCKLVEIKLGQLTNKKGRINFEQGRDFTSYIQQPSLCPIFPVVWHGRLPWFSYRLESVFGTRDGERLMISAYQGMNAYERHTKKRRIPRCTSSKLFRHNRLRLSTSHTCLPLPQYQKAATMRLSALPILSLAMTATVMAKDKESDGNWSRRRFLTSRQNVDNIVLQIPKLNLIIEVPMSDSRLNSTIGSGTGELHLAPKNTLTPEEGDAVSDVRTPFACSLRAWTVYLANLLY
jgi:hypothetical protein